MYTEYIIETYSRVEINAQARFWAEALRTAADTIPAWAQQIVGDFVEWTHVLDTLYREYRP